MDSKGQSLNMSMCWTLKRAAAWNVRKPSRQSEGFRFDEAIYMQKGLLDRTPSETHEPQGQLLGLLRGVAGGEDLEAEVASVGRRAGLLGLRGLRLPQRT